MREGRRYAFPIFPLLVGGFVLLAALTLWAAFWPLKVCTSCIDESAFNCPLPPKHGVTRIDWIDQRIDRLAGGGTYVDNGDYAGNATRGCPECHGRGKVALLKKVDSSKVLPYRIGIDGRF